MPGPCEGGAVLLADPGILVADKSDDGDTTGVVGVAGGITGIFGLVASSANKNTPVCRTQFKTDSILATHIHSYRSYFTYTWRWWKC